MLHTPGVSQPAMPAYFPSFVECAPPKSAGDGPRVISHWNPGRTYVEAIDDNLGRSYFVEAISFCRQIGAPFFMMRVLQDIRHSEFGSVESAFIKELANKATAGGNSPRMVDREASSLSRLKGCELELIRGVEGGSEGFHPSSELCPSP
ncbi:hypothetical protein [Bradyrhizobium genosp. P]|uniref:hypothetical protein n=1 Tax=Bradyrhizobium genosp. P TaxID=83641 RepID=UPI003CF25CA2